jgi:outer membrane protein
MNKLLFGAALAALSLAIPGAASAQRAPDAVIVIVDNSRVFGECTACRAATPQLQALIASAQQRQQTLSQSLQTEAQSIQAAAQLANNQAPGPARTAAEAALRQRAAALETRQNQANQELQRLEQNIQSVRANVARQIGERLNPVVSQVMTAHGANLALDQETTLAHAPALDVTNEVLAALNAALPSVSVTPMPQQAPPPGQPQGR